MIGKQFISASFPIPASLFRPFIRFNNLTLYPKNIVLETQLTLNNIENKQPQILTHKEQKINLLILIKEWEKNKN